ncbi:MAG: ABC transporter ATP-binding protein [Candidatus Methanoplasma sp.]|jgi:iron complex transport system ATP-binding protein|nr:ABC transporter ATP-binding protein [Candidatus Methanoplasma sp.]
MVNDEILEIDSLVYMYGDMTVLDAISLSVRRGEILGILGPNGCGKTTLLKNLNRNLSPHGGCVMIDGSDIEGMSKKEIAKKMSAVPQTNEIKFAFTVREIVGMGRMPFQESLRGASSEDLRIIDKAMEQTGILSMADRHINTMSGGERQRAIIARAVAQTPEIVLMDEPTLHLDINMQFEVLDLMRKLAKENDLTVVIVSHDLPMVTRYCDRIMLIHNHRVFAMGPPEDVLTEENMRLVFNVDAELEKDARTGKNTVRLFGSCKEHGSGI